MLEAEHLSLKQIEAFLNACQGIRFEGKNQEQIYRSICAGLVSVAVLAFGPRGWLPSDCGI
jgi:hypothetical protein